MKLKDKIAIVTGGGRGIGRAISLALAKEGAHVVVVDIRSARDVTNEIRKMGQKALAVKADVSNSSQVDQAVKETLNQFGRIDILVNNAGIVTVASVLDLKEEEWDSVLNVNAKGVFLFSKAVAKHMIKQQTGGKIVNISSDAGKTGEPLMAHYCASKFAVIGFTEAFAIEMAPYNVYVNAVCPSFVKTDMMEFYVKELSKLRGIPVDKAKANLASDVVLGRMATPEDVAKVVIFLASSDSDYITGEAINVTGGGAMKFCVGE